MRDTRNFFATQFFQEFVFVALIDNVILYNSVCCAETAYCFQINLNIWPFMFKIRWNSAMAPQKINKLKRGAVRILLNIISWTISILLHCVWMEISIIKELQIGWKLTKFLIFKIWEFSCLANNL